MDKLEQKYKEVCNAVKTLLVLEEGAAISKTADELKNISYVPPFLIDVPGFVDLDKKGILEAAKHIFVMKDEILQDLPIVKEKGVAEVKITTLAMLLHEYKLLDRLRRNEPEAWDEINELYEDD